MLSESTGTPVFIAKVALNTSVSTASSGTPLLEWKSVLYMSDRPPRPAIFTTGKDTAVPSFPLNSQPLNVSLVMFLSSVPALVS